MFDRVVAVGGLALLLVLHFDCWHFEFRREPGGDLWLGVLPAELGYRLGWMALAAAYLEWFRRRIWHDERDEDRT
jgi:hypothetical protein